MMAKRKRGGLARGSGAYNLFLKLGLFSEDARKRRSVEEKLLKLFGVGREIFGELNRKDKLAASHKIYHYLIRGEGEVGRRKRKMMELLVRGVDLSEVEEKAKNIDIDHKPFPPPGETRPYLVVARDFLESTPEALPFLFLPKDHEDREKLRELIEKYYREHKERINLLIGSKVTEESFSRSMLKILEEIVQEYMHPEVYDILRAMLGHVRGLKRSNRGLKYGGYEIKLFGEDLEKGFSMSYWLATGYCPRCGMLLYKPECPSCGWRASQPIAYPLSRELKPLGYLEKRGEKNNPNAPLALIRVGAKEPKKELLTLNPYHPVARYLLKALKSKRLEAYVKNEKVYYKVKVDDESKEFDPA